MLSLNKTVVGPKTLGVEFDSSLTHLSYCHAHIMHIISGDAVRYPEGVNCFDLWNNYGKRESGYYMLHQGIKYCAFYGKIVFI